MFGLNHHDDKHTHRADGSTRTVDGHDHEDARRLGWEPADEHDDHDDRRVVPTYEAHGEEAAHEEFGGINTGADFFGWLVAVAVSVLLMGILGAITAAVSAGTNLSQSDAERQAGNIGIAAAIVLVVIAGIGYYAGGYVAGRMSRFDGTRQGLGVWLIGLLAMVIAAATGAIFGREYDVLDRVDLPSLPISGTEASWGALITLGAFLLVTLLAALAGGRAGWGYHRRVDAAYRL